jgi:hypothetical protein
MEAPNSPREREKVRNEPAMSPSRIEGRVTRKSTCRSVAPSVLAASSGERGVVSRTAATALTMKGKVTNTCPRSRPGKENMIRMS